MDSTDLQHVFSTNLKNARNRAHISQLKLAEKADLSVGYICDLENGRRWGTPETFARLANALGIRAYELLLPADGSQPESLFAPQTAAELEVALHKAVSSAITDTFALLHPAQ